MIELYEDIAHSPVGPTVVDPRHELDALLVADKGFFRTIRTSLAPNTDLTATWSPMTSFNKYSTRSDLPGIHVAHFIAWLGSQFNTKSGYALQSLESIFDGNSMSGFMTRWPTSIYPDHIRNNQSKLINEHGMPLCF